MINRILVAVDRSERNKSVFNSAVALAKTTGSTLMLLHVLSDEEAGYPMLPTYAYYPIVDDRNYEMYHEKLEEYKQWGIDFLQQLTQQATEEGVATEYTQLTGNPGRTICELADTWEADLILVGSRGLKGIKEMFLGSVSNYVTHHAPCSVLIVRLAIAGESDSNDITSEEKLASNNQ
ncbi:universal stress protein [Pleurocapsa sp. PCC 7319]|uniref:universal stress protein n=1 Tax=Pleurocapsa sp. PCC 7319 TaxID=118161 RepID=UPI00034A9A5E|nr:universal stress protein [Pleurocapsa sp. PCC 7319]